MRRAFLLAVVVLPIGCAGRGPPDAFAPPRSDAELDARLHFVEQRLDAGHLHAAAWSWGWLVIDGLGGISQAVDADHADKSGDRARDIVNAVDSTLGVVDILVLRPMPGRHGAVPLRAMPDATHADKLAQLARGEAMLCATAERARARRSWPVHAGNLALALMGGGVLLGIGHSGAAATAASNFIGGELSIWSEPWRGTRDLEDYRHLVESGQPTAGEPARRFNLRPAPDGVALEMRF